MISELKSLQEWLGGLEKPCAIMCAWDYRARQVIDAAQTLGLHVPGDVFVLGVDDDEAICLSSDPPIPSVRMNADTAGYEAARLLDQMMRGERAADRVTYGPVDVSENFT